MHKNILLHIMNNITEQTPQQIYIYSLQTITHLFSFGELHCARSAHFGSS